MADPSRSGVSLDQALRDILPTSSDRQSFFSLMPAVEKDWSGEYTKFQKKLVSDFRSVDPSKPAEILYPLFISTYYEILLCNKDRAREFYSMNANIFLQEYERYPLVKKLFSSSPDDIKAFLKEPFEIRLLASEHVILVQTIKKTKCVYLTLLMQKYLKIKLLKYSAETSGSASSSNLQQLAKTVPALRNLKDALDNLEHSSILPRKIPWYLQNYFSAPKLLVMRLSGGGDVSGVVTCAQVCPRDLTMLAAGCEDASVRLHSLVERAQFCDAPGLIDLSVSGDVSRASGSGPGRARAICTQRRGSSGGRTPTQVVTLRGHLDRVTDLAFTQHPRYLLSSSVDKTVRLWDIKDRQSVAVYRGHHYPVWSVAVCEGDSNYFATTSHDRSCLLWSTDRLFPLKQFVGHTTDVNCVTFHPNGRYVATGGSDGQIRLYDICANRCVRLFLSRPASHTAPVDQQTALASNTYSSPPVLSLAVSPDGTKLAAGTKDGAVQVFDVSKEIVYLPSQATPHNSPVHSVAWTSETNGQYLVAGCLSGQVSSWSLSPGLSVANQVCIERVGLTGCSQLRLVRVQPVPETSSRVLVLGQDHEHQPMDSASEEMDCPGGRLPTLDTAPIMNTRD